MSTLVVEASSEHRRGCGYRRSGLYLESRGGQGGVLPRIVVIHPTSVPADGLPFRGFRYVSGDLLERAAENSPAIGAKFGQFAGGFYGFWYKMAGVVEPGHPAWEAVNWIAHRSCEDTPQSLVLYRLHIIADALETRSPSLRAEAKRLIALLE